MKIKYGKGITEYGPGVEIKLKGEEVAMAIYTYLTAHNVHIDGPATITVNGELCEKGLVYVDPSGYVVAKGKGYSGRGENSKYDCRHAEDRDKENTIQGIIDLNWIDIGDRNYDEIRVLKEKAKEVLNKKC